MRAAVRTGGPSTSQVESSAVLPNVCRRKGTTRVAVLGVPAALECLSGTEGVGTAGISDAGPLSAKRPTDLSLAGDVVLLLAVIGLIYAAFRTIAKNPWLPTSLALAIVFYALVNVRWWNTAEVSVDIAGLTSRPWIGDPVHLVWSDLTALGCASGDLFPVFQDDASLVVSGPVGADGKASKIEISRFLDRYPEVAAFVLSHVPTNLRPSSGREESPDVRP